MDNEFIFNLLYTVLGVAILTVAIMIDKLYKYRKYKETFESVQWCFASFHNEPSEARIRNYIFRLQRELCLDPEYLITKLELDAVNEILFSFRQNVIQEYFNGSYHKLGFSFEENLNRYLEKHQYDYRNNITYHKMHYILQIHYLKTQSIVDKNNLSVISANTTKEMIDDLLAK